jgi:preprotein translocase subunit SecA
MQHAEAISPIPAVPEAAGGAAAANAMQPEPDAAASAATPFVRQVPKVGRNEPCPCGSGKKYKYCHGTLQQANG